MTVSSDSARKLASLGGNLEITSGSKFSSASVEALVKIVVSNDGHIKIHASNFSSASLQKFVELGGANVTICI